MRLSPILCLFPIVLFAEPEKRPITTTGQLHARLVDASFELLVNGRLEGMGFLVDPNGYAVTVWHAVGGGKDRIEVRSGKLGRAEVRHIASDRGHDLALLKLPKREEPYPYLPLARNLPGPGNEVFLLGAPIFRHKVFIRGTIARKGTTFEYVNGSFVEGIHVSAITPGGCSGGAWVNRRGEVFGLQSASMTVNGTHQGIATATPVKAIRRILELKKDIHQPTLELAVEELWGQEVKYIREVPDDTRGLVVRQLKKNGVADKAGVKEWDLILKVNGKTIELTDEFMRFLRRKKPGQLIHLNVSEKDGGNPRKVKIELAPLK